MKKALRIIIGMVIVLSLCASFALAAVPDGWTSAAADAITVNSDKSITIQAKGNMGAQLQKEVTGDFTLEFQITAPVVQEGTDQKAVVAVMCPGADWIGGYWFRITSQYVQFNDGTDVPAYTETTPEATCAINAGKLNNVKIECKSKKLTFTVNGTKVAEVTPKVTTGKYICVGGNYAFVAPKTEKDLTEKITIKGMKLTVGSETFKYFGDADATVVNPTPASSAASSSKAAVSSAATSSSPKSSIPVADKKADAEIKQSNF